MKSVCFPCSRSFLWQLFHAFAHEEGTALLYSGEGTERFSFLCLFPEEKVCLDRRDPLLWDTLESRLSLPCLEHLPPHPLWVGYLGYEMGCCADEDRTVGMPPAVVPPACFYRPSCVLRVDHHKEEGTLWGNISPSILEKRRKTAKSLPSFHLAARSDTLEGYIEKIEKIKEMIRKGEIYQVNLSQEFVLEGKADPALLFENVVTKNPTAAAAYLHGGSFTILSASPERFLQKRGETLISTPIKGTAPRGKDDSEDAQRLYALLHSEKERSELLMITDLIRNDLSRVCLPGSVRVKQMFSHRAYVHIFHLFSLVEARVAKGFSPVSILRKLFPGGSITGCPKLAAMEVIAALEKRGRGVYTGAIGYFAANADFDFNIAIRTLVVSKEYLQLQVGGGIVIDSDPYKEYLETLHKGKGFFSLMGIDEFCHS